MQNSKPIPVWLLVTAIIALVVSVALKLGFDSIVAAFHPAGVIADMRLRNSLTLVMYAVYLVTAGLAIAIILMAAARGTKQ